MKTILAKEKSEYSHCLMNVINYNLPEQKRQTNYDRMKELEDIVKIKNDELQIVITSKNTNKMKTAPSMTMEDIKNG